MEDGQLIVPLLRSRLDQWAALLSKSPEGIALAAISFQLRPVGVVQFQLELPAMLSSASNGRRASSCTRQRPTALL